MQKGAGNHIGQMSQVEFQEYLKFMTDPENIGNCDECPENQDFDAWQNRKPCGQQNCWVACHVKAMREYEGDGDETDVYGEGA